MARYDPVKECAQDRTGQRISGDGSTSRVGGADITYPVAFHDPPPVDERSWLTGHQGGNPLSTSSSGRFDSTSSLVPSRGHHHRLYTPYPIPSISTAVPSFSLSESHRERLSTQMLPTHSHHPGRSVTPLTDPQEIPVSSWMPADFSPPSIPNHVSPLPAPLPITQTDPPWQSDNYPTVGTSTQSPSSSPAHSPSRDTPTPIDRSAGGGSKGKKRSRGRYRKEDPADRYLRENMEDGNRLWTCMWVEPSHGAPDSPAAQNMCGHQAPKSNARQHVKSRHLKLRPYTCPECGRTWRDQGARYNHRVREHGYVPKKPKRWLDDDATLEGGTSSDNSHLNVSFVMESLGQ